jgi:diguanylate cyclase (GGDEF)-like protein
VGTVRNEETDVADLGAELVAELASDQSGLAIIYRALDGLVAQYELHDAAIVIDESGLGRQVFRAARKPLDDPGGEALLDAEPGLYTDPPLEAAVVDASLLSSLCVVALRMEVLRYDSWHDPLTGLFDRRSFDRLLDMSVARSLRYHWPFTLVVIDLDGLKEINDNEGHAAGDAALQALSERFRRVLRFGDNAARIGGDEFAVILPNTDPDDVPMLLERIGSSQLGDRPCPAFSYGVAQCPAEADDTTSLFKLADSRLYEAKKARP